MSGNVDEETAARVDDGDDVEGEDWERERPGPGTVLERLVRPGGEREARLRRAAGWGGLVVLLVALLLLGIRADVTFLEGLRELNVVRIIVLGLQSGVIYSLIALGIALVYKATRILNFAQGEFGTVAAFFALVVYLRADIAAELTARPGLVEMLGVTLLAVAVGASIGVLVNLAVVERLARANELTALVATVAVMLALVAFQAVVFEIRNRNFPRYVPGAPCLGPEGDGGVVSLCPLRVAGIFISWHTIIVAITLGIIAIVLALFFRTRVGVALLATAQEPFAAQLQGVSPRAMATLAWGTAGALGAIGGLLGVGNFEEIFPGYMTVTFLVGGFTAAVLGGITSMVGAVVGGLLLGLVVEFAATAVHAYGVGDLIPGVPHAATFLVLLLVLVLRPRGLLGKEV